MNQQELQARHDSLIDLLRKMRGAQRDYFKNRSSTDLEDAKKYERDVDKFIETELKIQKSLQKELF